MTWEQFEKSQTDLLDVRSEGQPFAGAVRIPWPELSARLGELPPDGSKLRIANTGPEAREAAKFLQERRPVLETDFEFGEGDQPLRLWSPNEFLAAVAPNLQLGTAVDLACGCGREATALASCGWEVNAVDHLPDALERAERLARHFGVERVAWLQADLADWGFSCAPDLVTMFLYLYRDLIERSVDALAPGGSLLFESFSHVNRAERGKPRRAEFATSADELGQLCKGLVVRHASEDWRPSGRHTVRFWATKL